MPPKPAKVADSDYPYFTISAPRDLMHRIEALVKGHPELGYSSASAAAVEGIRKFAVELEARIAAGRIAQQPDGVKDEAVIDLIHMIQGYFERKRADADPGKTRRGKSS